MLTLAGEIPEGALRKVVIREATPCGQAITTQWFLGEELVRQDCEIAVERGLISTSEAGRI